MNKLIEERNAIIKSNSSEIRQKKKKKVLTLSTDLSLKYSNDF